MIFLERVLKLDSLINRNKIFFKTYSKKKKEIQ